MAVEPTQLIRIMTAGSVDDGKSTLVGRLLLDTGSLYDDHRAALESDARQRGTASLGLALLTDGLKAEREQGITIDVAYRYFGSEHRRFILADAPGHVEYTRNMATAASNAHVAILLVDAQMGITEQTRRHALIAALFGVPRILVAVNKMDLVDFSRERFEAVVREFSGFARKLSAGELHFMPISALSGDNVARRSSAMPWYEGQTILQYLDSVHIGPDKNLLDLRFPVQLVLHPATGIRLAAGTVISGELRSGEDIVVLPKGSRTRVRDILVADARGGRTSVERASCGDAVAVQLDDEVDVSRGMMIARPLNRPRVVTSFEAMLVWFSEAPCRSRGGYLIRQTTASVRLADIRPVYALDASSFHRTPPVRLECNSIVCAEIRVTEPICVDTYTQNRESGSFIIVDVENGETVGAGIVIDRARGDQGGSIIEMGEGAYLHSVSGLVTQGEREQRAGRRALTIWMTGLSGAGKSSVAVVFERQFFDSGAAVFRLDGDDLRQGLCVGLGFSREERSENVRRAAEAAALMNRAGVTVICALISPFEMDRAAARAIIGAERFVEVFVSTSLEVCESRDPHGLYAKARANHIRDFTGISAPYEPPRTPALELNMGELSIEEAVDSLWCLVRKWERCEGPGEGAAGSELS